MLIVLIVALAALAGACASVTRGLDETVRIETDPPGADARTSLGQTCVTPCAIPIARKHEFDVTISKQGYATVQTKVHTVMGGGGAAGIAGNVILGGVTGMVVDATTGATLDHCPNPLVVQLQPIGGVPPRAQSRRGSSRRVVQVEPEPIVTGVRFIEPPEKCKPVVPPPRGTPGRD